MPAATSPAVTMPAVIWSSIGPDLLAGVRTDFLRSVDLQRIPASAATAIRQELAARRVER